MAHIAPIRATFSQPDVDLDNVVCVCIGVETIVLFTSTAHLAVKGIIFPTIDTARKSDS